MPLLFGESSESGQPVHATIGGEACGEFSELLQAFGTVIVVKICQDQIWSMPLMKLGCLHLLNVAVEHVIVVLWMVVVVVVAGSQVWVVRWRLLQLDLV